MPFWMCSTL